MTVLCQGPRRQQNTWWWKTDGQRLYSICSCGGHVRVNLLIISVPKLPVGFLEINFVPPVFCPHGICYGFEVMQSCESPRHPFNIFRHRFQKAPQVIVYNNACKLHQFCLNRNQEHSFCCRPLSLARPSWMLSWLLLEQLYTDGHKGNQLTSE